MKRQLYLVGLAVVMMVTALGQTPIAPVLPSTHFMSNFVNDVVFGESGKDGALIFDGVTTSQRGVVTMTGNAIGNGDFTVYTRCYVPRLPLPLASPTLLCISSVPISSPGNGFRLYGLPSSDRLLAVVVGPVNTDIRGLVVESFFSTYGGRIVDVVAVRQGASMALYLNGLPAPASAFSLGASPPSLDIDVQGPYVQVGNLNNSPWNDRVFRAVIFNYALSAQEVLDLSYQGTTPQALGRFRHKIIFQGKNGQFNDTAGNWTPIGTAALTYDAANDELDVNAAAGGDGAQLPAAQFEPLKLGVLHRVTFDVRNDGSSLAKTVLWGAQTVGTCSGNSSFWFEFTPTLAATDFKVTSAAGTWSLANLRVTEVGSADGGKVASSYASDFTAGGDSWTAQAGTLAGNIDSIGGENDTLRFFADGTAVNHLFRRQLSGVAGRVRTRVSFRYYIPSANTTLKRFYVHYNLDGAATVVIPSYDTWNTHTVDLDDSAAGLLEIVTLNASNGTYTGAGVVTDDLMYIKDVTVREIADTSELANGGFDEAGAGGDPFTWWVEAASGSTAVSRETTSAETVSGGSARGSAKIVVDGANAAGSVTARYVMRPSRKYRLKFNAKVDSTSGTPTLQVQTGSTPVYTNTLTTSFAQTTVDFVSVSRDLKLVNGTGCASRTIWIDNVELEDIGPVFDLDCAVGLGMQAHDRTANMFHATLKGDVRHAKPMRRAVVRGRTNTNGNQQLLGDYCIPLNGRIMSIAVVSDGSATVSLGSSSGGTSIASGAAVTAGRNEVTVAGRYSSTGNIWVTANSTANLDWVIYYELVD